MGVIIAKKGAQAATQFAALLAGCVSAGTGLGSEWNGPASVERRLEAEVAMGHLADFV